MTALRTQRARVGLRAAAGAAVAALMIGVLGAAPASAAPTTTLVYSTDGGATWTPNPTVGAGQQVIARLYYANDTPGTIAGTQLTTAIPAGFTLVPGSTTTCLNPGTNDPTNPTSELACNTDAGQGGAINESAVWSGGNLTISPTAGLLTQSPSATSGILQVGEPRYLNLDQCNYFGPTLRDSIVYIVPTTPNTPPFSAGSGTGNTAQASPVCGPGAGGFPYQPSNSGVANIPLLGQRYVNLAQCNYYGSSTDSITYFVPSTPNAPFHASTGASNTTPALPTCGPGAGGYPYQAGNSGITNIDLLGNTVLNLDQCIYYGTTTDAITYAVPSTPNAGFTAATTASNASPSLPTCGPGRGGYPYQPTNSGIGNFNLVDTGRGQGFVQFVMTAPSPATTLVEPQTGGLTGTGTGDPTTTGTLTVAAVGGAPLAEGWPAVIATASALLVAGVWFAIRRKRVNAA